MTTDEATICRELAEAMNLAIAPCFVNGRNVGYPKGEEPDYREFGNCVSVEFFTDAIACDALEEWFLSPPRQFGLGLLVKSSADLFRCRAYDWANGFDWDGHGTTLKEAKVRAIYAAVKARQGDGEAE